MKNVISENKQSYRTQVDLTKEGCISTFTENA